MSVHPAAQTGFGRAADEYELGRPDYPPEAIAWLAERLLKQRLQPRPTA